MKIFKVLLAVSAAAIGTVVLSAAAPTKPAHPPGKPGGCCVKAEKEGRTCAHPCCVEAAKANKNCEKCKGTNT